MMIVADIRLQCTEGTSNKYWYGQVVRSTAAGKPVYVFTTHYGRIGTTGQQTDKAASNVYNAFTMLLSKLKEKIKKGYVFRDDSSIINKSAIEHYEKDLEIARARFLVSAKTLKGWIDPPLIGYAKTKAHGAAGASEHPSMKPPPEAQAPKVFRKAMILI